MAISVEQTSGLSLRRRLLKIDNLKLYEWLVVYSSCNCKTVGDYYKRDSV